MDCLREWLRRTGTTQVQLSEATGIPQPLLSKYITGKLCPRVTNAVKIEKATGGEVPVEVWIDAEPGDDAIADGQAA